MIMYFAYLLKRNVYSIGTCRAAVQIAQWLELERANLVRQLSVLRSVSVFTMPNNLIF